MFVSRMTVAHRLYAGFGLIVALLIAVTAVAVVKVNRIDQALQSNTELHAQVQRYAIDFRGSVHDRSIAVRDLVLSPTRQDREREIETINTLAKAYEKAATSLNALLTHPGITAETARLYREIQRSESVAVNTTNTILSQIRTDNSAAAQTLWQNAKPQYEQWLAVLNQLIDYKEQLIQANNRSALSDASSFLQVMFTVLFLAILLSTFVAWRVAHSIVHQLGEEPEALANVARDVAQGNLLKVKVCEKAPPHSVMASLGHMQASLVAVVEKVRHASRAVTVGAHAFATNNADLLQRTEEQAYNLKQAAGSMDEMTASVKHNADTAQQASQLAAAASQTAQQGGELVTQVVQTMQDISASSHRIADIISLIDSIAFQTNILALNAAVEAARAGEDGRGFAVVAGEVRALAQRSAEAARQIKNLIETSVAKVEQGTSLVSTAGITMTDIVTQAQQVADLIARISAASAQQTRGIADVGAVVANLDQATQLNASMVEQSARAAHALEEQATALAAAVEVFRV